MSSFGPIAWAVLGLVLLGVEVFAPGTYFLFFGIGALLIAANGFVGPDLGLAVEVVGFLLVSAVATGLGYRWYGGSRGGPARAGLNRRTERLVGTTGTVAVALGTGGGRVTVEDGGWPAEGPPLPAGTAVRIVGARGSTLLVEPLETTSRE